MEDENLDAVETTTDENVETQTTEQKEVKNTEKTFTQEELNEIVKSRVASTKRAEEKKYSQLVNALKTGMGENSDDLNALTRKVIDSYKEQGVDIPESPKYSEEDEQILANAEAQRIIEMGYDAIVAEENAMNSMSELSSRDKKMYEALKNKREEIDNLNQLKSIGVTEDEIQSKEFKDFAKKFNKDTSYTEIYNLYEKTKPKIEPSSIGSMKSTSTEEEIKDYYSPEDFDKLTDEQLNNPKIWEKVMESKKKWTK